METGADDGRTRSPAAKAHLLLHALGFPRIRGYVGSWSDWGNREDTPVETGNPDP